MVDILYYSRRYLCNLYMSIPTRLELFQKIFESTLLTHFPCLYEEYSSLVTCTRSAIIGKAVDFFSNSDIKWHIATKEKLEQEVCNMFTDAGYDCTDKIRNAVTHLPDNAIADLRRKCILLQKICNV